MNFLLSHCCGEEPPPPREYSIVTLLLRGLHLSVSTSMREGAMWRQHSIPLAHARAQVCKGALECGNNRYGQVLEKPCDILKYCAAARGPPASLGGGRLRQQSSAAVTRSRPHCVKDTRRWVSSREYTKTTTCDTRASNCRRHQPCCVIDIER